MTPEMRNELEKRTRYALRLVENIPLMEFARVVVDLYWNSNYKDDGISIVLDQCKKELQYRWLF